MHKIASKEFTLEDFSTEYLLSLDSPEDKQNVPFIDVSPFGDDSVIYSPKGWFTKTICLLNKARNKYLQAQENGADGFTLKQYWWQMIQLLPSSYNQRRTVMFNYEVLANIYKSRKDHKLDEWREFCKWIETLPYSELITGNTEGVEAK